MTETLADKLQRLCCAETESKFFDCVTDNVEEIIAALRAAQPASPLQGREYLAPSPCSDLSIGELIEWLDNPQWTNGYLNSDAANHISAAAELIERLVSSAPPEQPASPLRGREAARDAIMGAARLYTHDHTTAYKITEMAIEAIFSASPPEQPAADPVAGRDDLGIVLSALRYFEEIVGEKFHDEGGVIAAIERDHKFPTTPKESFGSPVWPGNENDDLDKGDDA